LVEKPVATTSRAATAMAHAAAQYGTKLGAAHVFLFASYLQNFARRVARGGVLRSIALSWADPVAEARHGEVKRYDVGLPVFADCLPHALAIVGQLVPAIPVLRDVQVRRGGAAVLLIVSLGEVSCRIHLERNALRRQRLVEVQTDTTSLTLDFSTEPGDIQEAGAVVSSDPHWGSATRPVAGMLSAFLGWVGGAGFDPRLDFSSGMRACGMIDSIAPRYAAAVHAWLTATLDSSVTLDEDVRYALTELLYANGPLRSVDRQEMLKGILAQLGASPAVTTGLLVEFAEAGVES
jgi:predicted dehydrogenase